MLFRSEGKEEEEGKGEWTRKMGWNRKEEGAWNEGKEEENVEEEDGSRGMECIRHAQKEIFP